MVLSLPLYLWGVGVGHLATGESTINNSGYDEQKNEPRIFLPCRVQNKTKTNQKTNPNPKDKLSSGLVLCFGLVCTPLGKNILGPCHTLGFRVRVRVEVTVRGREFHSCICGWIRYWSVTRTLTSSGSDWTEGRTSFLTERLFVYVSFTPQPGTTAVKCTPCTMPYSIFTHSLVKRCSC